MSHMDPALTLQIAAGCLLALVTYHVATAGLKLYLRSETRNAMRGLAIFGIAAMWGGFLIWGGLIYNP